jgi:trans-aconitate methyltransferase
MFENMPAEMSVSKDEAYRIASACPPGGTVLEIGCHLGNGTERIINALPNGSRVIGIDNDPERVASASRRGLDADFIVADSRTFVPNFKPDVILVDGGLSTRSSDVRRFKKMFPEATVFLHDALGAGRGQRMVRV